MNKSRPNGKPLAAAINPNKIYRVSYLSPTQSTSGEYEYGDFELLGKDLTEKQIIELNERGWIGEPVKCDLCAYKWVAVYHEDCDKLECPNCRNMTLIVN